MKFRLTVDVDDQERKQLLKFCDDKHIKVIKTEERSYF